MPVEISLNAIRFGRQNDLSVGDYHDLMMDNIDEVTDKRMKAPRQPDGSVMWPREFTLRQYAR